MKKIPMRKCIACGVQKPKKELVRVVKNKENEIFVDYTGKQNGRGAYICGTKACFDLAIKKNAFNRALECKVEDTVFEDLKERLKEDA
ncbi:RNase P modulator RnpM [Fusibacter sp. JL298sf-3]